MVKVVLLGSGGHSKSVVDSIEQSGQYKIAGFLEVTEKQQFSYRGHRVIGQDSYMQELYRQGVHHAVITIGFMGGETVRNALYHQLKEIGFQLPVIIDPSAVIAKDAIFGEGTFIGKRAVVNANARIEKMCIINSGAIIEHDSFVGEFSHIAVGATICGEARIGNYTLVGANATVIQERVVGSKVVIGAGSVVIRDVLDNWRVAGNPARKIV